MAAAVSVAGVAGEEAEMRFRTEGCRRREGRRMREGGRLGLGEEEEMSIYIYFREYYN